MLKKKSNLGVRYEIILNIEVEGHICDAYHFAVMMYASYSANVFWTLFIVLHRAPTAMH